MESDGWESSLEYEVHDCPVCEEEGMIEDYHYSFEIPLRVRHPRAWKCACWLSGVVVGAALMFMALQFLWVASWLKIFW